MTRPRLAAAWLLMALAAPALAAPVSRDIARAAAQLARKPAADAVPAPVGGCALLSESGPVAAPAPMVLMPATPTPDRHFECPDDFRLDLQARVPMCSRPGIKVVDGNPRAACYAAMTLGPLAPVAPRHRPSRSCKLAQATTIVRLEGRNIGWGDVELSVLPAAGVTATTLTASGADVPEAENPVLQRCFAGDCRLVKLEIGPAAAPAIVVRLVVPGGDSAEARIALVAECRDPDLKATR